MKSNIFQGHGLQILYVALLSLVLPIYVVLAFAASEVRLSGAFSLLYLPFLLLLFLFLGFWNIAASFRAYKEKDAVYFVNGMLILKYGLILFFVLSSLVSVLILLLAGLLPLGLLVASRGTLIFALPLMLPLAFSWFFAILGIVVVVGWLILLPGAFWGIQVIRKSLAEGKLTPGKALLHGLLQFLFLADVLDAMYLSVRIWNRGKKSALLVALLYAAVLVSILFLISGAV